MKKMSNVESRESRVAIPPSTVDRRPSTGFTLIEVMLVVTLLVLIIFALMKVFSTTQGAFRASITQADVLEGGRAAIDLIANDLKPMAAANVDQTNYTGAVMNFYAFRTNNFTQSLPASGFQRTNVMEDVFFLTHANQGWTGIGYFVRTNDFHAPTDLGVGAVGGLYRYETNVTAAEFARNPDHLYAGFNLARSGSPPPGSTSRIMSGVMGFKVHAFNANGFWIITNFVNNASVTNIYAFGNLYGDVGTYGFYGNALPVSVEVEIAVLEDRPLQRLESLPTTALQNNYLLNLAGKVHVFRQRVFIPNADPSAYQ